METGITDFGFHALRLTGEQLEALTPFINTGLNIVAEIRLASLTGEQSQLWLFVKVITPQQAAKIRKLLSNES